MDKGAKGNKCESFPGVVTLLKEHQVCKEGDALTPEQARILVSRVSHVGLFGCADEAS